MAAGPNIIQIYKHKAVQEIPQYVINQSLEYRRCIGGSEGHYQILKMSQRGVKDHLPLITLPDSDQMICVPEIQFSEDSGAMEWFKSRFD